MAWNAYRADVQVKTIEFGKYVRSYCSYLANMVELCFCNTLDFLVRKLCEGKLC